MNDDSNKIQIPADEATIPKDRIVTKKVEVQETAIIQISRIPAETIIVPILGTSPLCVHNFSQKAKQQMLDAMKGIKRPKEPKNPEAEYEGSRYRFSDDAHRWRWSGAAARR